MKILEKIINSEQRTVWVIFIFCALLVTTGYVIWPEANHKSGTENKKEVVRQMPAGVGKSIEINRLGQSGVNALMSEEATLFDPTPLFLPTEWNSGQNALPANLIRVPGRIFESYPAKLIYREASLISSPASEPNSVGAVELLTLIDRESPIMALGKSERNLIKLTERGAQIEIISAQTGQLVLALAVREAKVPGEGWRPMEFLVAVDAAGVVGAPVITVRSSSEQVDRFFQEFLTKTFQLGKRLAPGAYRIWVGP